MEKRSNAVVTVIPEWKKADQVVKADAKSIAVEVRHFGMGVGQPIITAYREINEDVLPQLSSETQSALLELARALSRKSNNTWTLAITRFEEATVSPAGLRIDGDRIKVLGLASKPGIVTFFKQVCDSYGKELQKSRFVGFTGLGWGQPQLKFLLVTLPLEGRANLDRMAEDAGFVISKTAPQDPMTDRRTLHTHFAEYPVPLLDNENLFYLVHNPKDAVHEKPASSDELRKFESLLNSEAEADEA